MYQSPHASYHHQREPIWEVPHRPVRMGVKMGSIVCFLAGTAIAMWGWSLPLAGLLGLAGFILVWFI